MHDFHSHAVEIEEIDQDDINNVLHKTHLLIQEHSEKLPVLQSIREKLNSAIGENIPDTHPIPAQYKNVELKYKVRNILVCFILRNHNIIDE